MANEFKIRKGLIVEGASGGTVVDVQGSQDQLFSVTDDLSGSIFAVSDISGVPIFDVNSSGISYFDGKVGIGTTSPSEKLNVNGNILATGTILGSNLSGTNTGDQDLSGYLLLSGGTVTGNLTLSYAYPRINLYDTNNDSDYSIINNDGSFSIYDVTNNSHRLSIASGGNATFAGSINTTYVNSGGFTDGYIIWNAAQLNRYGAAIELQFTPTNASTTVKIGANGSNPTTFNAYTGEATFTGNVGIGTTNPGYKLTVNGDIFVYNGDRVYLGGANSYLTSNTNFDMVHSTGRDHVFTTDPLQSTAEQLRITEDGDVGIGTASPSQKLHVVGISGATTGLQIINSYGSPTINAYYSAFTTSAALYVGTPFSGLNCYASAFNITSDYRLKENIIELTGAISKVKNLRPVRFNYKNKEETINGFIAHEVQDVVPEAVTGEKDALYEDGKEKYQGLDNGKLVPLLTAALQEAITKIEQLETRIQTLENNN